MAIAAGGVRKNATEIPQSAPCGRHPVLPATCSHATLAGETGNVPGNDLLATKPMTAEDTEPLRSMTAFAAFSAPGPGGARAWEIRSVNGRGLDLRLRLPEGIEGLEPLARAAVAARVRRGSMTLSLRIARDPAAWAGRLSDGGLAAALANLARVEVAAADAGLALAPTTAAAVLALPGVVVDPAGAAADNADADPEAGGEAARVGPLAADLDRLLEAFDAMRAAEGAALGRVLGLQLDRIATLIDDARAAARNRPERARAALAEAVARILGESVAIDPARLAQELALIAVRTDIAEELDRLDAHVAAARELLARGGAAGRRLDFLMQEFNREANTLCAKAQDQALTRIGLDLKSVIDQMREQVQNLE